MAKKNFTANEKPIANSFIASETKEEAPAKTKSTKRAYKRLDVMEEAPEEYRFTARMPGIYGVYLNEKAYRTRSTITAVLQKLVKEDMEKHPEILEELENI